MIFRILLWFAMMRFMSATAISVGHPMTMLLFIVRMRGQPPPTDLQPETARVKGIRLRFNT